MEDRAVVPIVNFLLVRLLSFTMAVSKRSIVCVCVFYPSIFLFSFMSSRRKFGLSLISIELFLFAIRDRLMNYSLSVMNEIFFIV